MLSLCLVPFDDDPLVVRDNGRGLRFDAGQLLWVDILGRTLPAWDSSIAETGMIVFNQVGTQCMVTNMDATWTDGKGPRMGGRMVVRGSVKF